MNFDKVPTAALTAANTMWTMSNEDLDMTVSALVEDMRGREPAEDALCFGVTLIETDPGNEPMNEMLRGMYLAAIYRLARLELERGKSNCTTPHSCNAPGGPTCWCESR